MVAAAATNGDVLIRNVIPKHLESITAKLREIGAVVEEYDEDIRVRDVYKRQAFSCRNKSQPHAGIPAGRFNDSCSGMQNSFRFCKMCIRDRPTRISRW